jgi:type II secretory pathway component GspD/PulD (secretin)
MKTTSGAWVGLGLVCLLLTASAAWADPAADAGKLEDRVDLALKNAAPEEVFRTFAKMLGAEAAVDPGVHGPLSVELHNVRVRTLLDTVCESLGCRWRLESGSPPKLRVLPAAAAKSEANPATASKPAIKEAIDLRVTKADGLEVLRTFGEVLGSDVVIDPAIKGLLSLNLEALPVDQCLDTVCQSLACEWSYTEGANGRKGVLRITARKR